MACPNKMTLCRNTKAEQIRTLDMLGSFCLSIPTPSWWQLYEGWRGLEIKKKGEELDENLEKEGEGKRKNVWRLNLKM